MSNVRRVSFAWIIVCLLLLGGHKTGFTQADDGLWSQPVNLSHSGAAVSPVLVVGPEQQMQVFWWDRFDGVTTSYAFGNDWSAPTAAPVGTDDPVPDPACLDRPVHPRWPSHGQVHPHWPDPLHPLGGTP